MNPAPRTFPVTKPPRYRAPLDLSARAVASLAVVHETALSWRKAAAYWRALSRCPGANVASAEQQRATCLGLATTDDLADAFRAYRESLGVDLSDPAARDVRRPGELSYRAFAHRWLVAADCAHEHFAASGLAREGLVAGMVLDEREDRILAACREVSTCGDNLVPFAIERLTDCRSTFALWNEAMDGAEEEVGFFAGIAVVLAQRPSEAGHTRPAVYLTGTEVPS